MSIVAVGDRYFVLVFRLVGIRGREVSDEKEAEEEVKKLISNEECRVIILDERLAFRVKRLREEIMRKEKPYPIFVIVPGLEGSKGLRIQEMHNLIEQAIGVRLKFED
ncbi:hypothetical protein CW710_00070 [Candidatus Bathyarchaeota archaeon]|nr:V-type ATP synthase subunit F [Candidatus Bathyarchaeota archaeon]RJS75085.1 MAG: hypothetical protein CW710_00070 [Candidatus Bathyarchaeota archaeon]